MFNDTRTLLRLLFKTSPSEVSCLTPLKMDTYPFDGYKYMSWCGRIIYSKDRYANVSDVDFNHESIHLSQARDEGSWVRYYLKYLWEWMKVNPLTQTLCCYATSKYETEAYAKENDFTYLSRREVHAENKFIIPNRKEWWYNLTDNYKKVMKEEFKDI